MRNKLWKLHQELGSALREVGTLNSVIYRAHIGSRHHEAASPSPVDVHIPMQTTGNQADYSAELHVARSVSAGDGLLEAHACTANFRARPRLRDSCRFFLFCMFLFTRNVNLRFSTLCLLALAHATNPPSPRRTLFFASSSGVRSNL